MCPHMSRTKRRSNTVSNLKTVFTNNEQPTFYDSKGNKHDRTMTLKLLIPLEVTHTILLAVNFINAIND